MKAEKYEQRWRPYLKKTHSDVIGELEKHAQQKNDMKMLDVSTGTGIIYKKLMKSDLSLSEVIFNDPDKKMLSNGRKQMIREAFDTKSRFTHDTAEDLRYSEENFDIILSANAYHRYTDQIKFLEEAYRCLKPGGLLLIQDWNHETWFKPIHTVIQLYDSASINAQSAEEVSSLAAQTGFTPIKCKRWCWYWWRFYTLVAQK